MGRFGVAAAVVVCAILLASACAAVAAVIGGGSGLATASAAASGGGWGAAQQVPGLAALVSGSGDSGLNSVSCAGPGDCSGGGFFYPSAQPSPSQAFVVSQVNGVWRRALPVPGLAELNKAGSAAVVSVSCGSAGNCSAGGYYASSRSSGGVLAITAFVVSQVNGAWGTARQVPGLAALNTGEQAQISSIACASPGNCSAGGSYGVPAGPSCCTSHAFAVTEVNGKWGRAEPVPGMTGIGEVSCPSAANCGAAGGGLVVSQVDGAWGNPTRVSGATSGFGKVTITVISCAAPGDCSAAGYHQGRNALGIRAAHTVVASQVNGKWGIASELAGSVALTRSGRSEPASLSCAAAGKCVLGGQGFWQAPAGSSTRAFAVAYVAIQRKGIWGRAKPIQGLQALSKHGYSVITSVACAAPGSCAVAGRYSTTDYNPDGSGPSQAFTVSRRSGLWTSPHVVTSTLANDGAGAITAVFCPAPDRCTAVGYYWFGRQERAFTASQVPAQAAAAYRLALSASDRAATSSAPH
jgi:hypothetical protein